MPNYDRSTVKQIIRARCDLESTTFESETSLEIHINDAAAVLHDLLIAAAGSNYAVERASFNTQAGSPVYTIPDSNFYKLIRMEYAIDGLAYPLSPFEEEDAILDTNGNAWGPGWLPRYQLSLNASSQWRIRFDPTPASVYAVNLIYHTKPPEYLTDQDSVSIPFADYLVVEACIRIKDKEDRDTARLERERAMIQKRIEDWGATFDRANPHQTIDVTATYRRGLWRRDRAF